ncbi:four-carbon acid sugar kinase family protein [Microvirga sp. P5_D2]
MALSYGWYGDDFTGATDTLATIARRGRRAFLFLRVPEERHLSELNDLDAIGFTGAARTMNPAEMQAELAPVGAFFRKIGVRVVHYKCCSTFDSALDRGNIAAAVAVLREYVESTTTTIIGGQPSLGRYCAFSNLFATFGANGETFRLDRHPTMSRHPATPMNEADLTKHIASLGLPEIASIHWPLLDQGAEALSEEWGRLAGSASAVLFDALTPSHIAAIGQLCRAVSQKQSLLIVGASSVAQAYFEETGAPAIRPNVSAEGPVLAFVGSLSPMTRVQVAAAQSYHRISIDPESLTTSDGAREQIIAKAVEGLSQGLNVMLSTAPESGEAPKASMDTLADCSAALVDAVIKRHRVSRLAVAGGDTSSKIVGGLGFWGLGYHGQISNGVAVSVARSDDRERDSMLVMLKGGQMGHEQLFETFLERDAAW